MSSDYFEYLRTRNLTGLLYRKYWLYPRLRRELQGRVLDVGCGIGDFLDSYPGAVGVDINARAVDWCRRKGLDARQMEVDHLPFDDASFQGVVLDNVLEHVKDPTELLKEIRRVLVPGGRLVVGVPGPRGYAADPDHKVFYDEPGLDTVLATAHFGKRGSFHMPFECEPLGRRLAQYCIYGVFEKV